MTQRKIERQTRRKESSTCKDCTALLTDSSSVSSETDDEADSTFQSSSRLKHQVAKTPKVQCLPSLAVASDRTGTSDRSAALTATSVLQDVEVINEDDTALVVDRNKVRCARKRAISDALEEEKVFAPLKSIFFDGRKDKTMLHQTVKLKMFKKIVTEEHVS